MRPSVFSAKGCDARKWGEQFDNDLLQLSFMTALSQRATSIYQWHFIFRCHSFLYQRLHCRVLFWLSVQASLSVYLFKWGWTLYRSLFDVFSGFIVKYMYYITDIKMSAVNKAHLSFLKTEFICCNTEMFKFLFWAIIYWFVIIKIGIKYIQNSPNKNFVLITPCATLVVFNFYTKDCIFNR